MSVGANRIAAQAEIFLTSSFCSVARLAEAAHLLVLLLGDERGVDGEHVAERVAELVDALDDLGEVVLDVAEVALELLVDVVLGEPGAQRRDHVGQRPGGPLELGDLRETARRSAATPWGRR